LVRLLIRSVAFQAPTGDPHVAAHLIERIGWAPRRRRGRGIATGGPPRSGRESGITSLGHGAQPAEGADAVAIVAWIISHAPRRYVLPVGALT
jgi:hypothetical protein